MSVWMDSSFIIWIYIKKLYFWKWNNKQCSANFFFFQNLNFFLTLYEVACKIVNFFPVIHFRVQNIVSVHFSEC